MALDEALKGSIPGLFHIIRETAGRQLIHPQMILKALTAFSLPGAWFISAVAVFHIPGNIAFHDCYLLYGLTMIFPLQKKTPFNAPSEIINRKQAGFNPGQQIPRCK